jgi:hypothetical protein
MNKQLFDPMCLAFICIALLFMVQLSAIGSIGYLVFVVSLYILGVMSLLTLYFFANIETSAYDALKRIHAKREALHHGYRHSLREVQKQLTALDKAGIAKDQAMYNDKLLKELAELTRRVDTLD